MSRTAAPAHRLGFPSSCAPPPLVRANARRASRVFRQNRSKADVSTGGLTGRPLVRVRDHQCGEQAPRPTTPGGPELADLSSAFRPPPVAKRGQGWLARGANQNAFADKGLDDRVRGFGGRHAELFTRV